nr:M14 family metallopeptidase [uncultured Blautia sp.]
MSEMINIGGLSAAHGQRVHGFITIGNGEFSLPATIIRGEKPGKTALITAGIHAGEYVGIQSAVELGRDLKIEKMTGTVIIVKVVGREEFENRYGSLCRENQENLNRVFPGKKDGTKYEKLAYAVVEELQKAADYYIDLHSGDDYEKLTPYVYYAGKASPEVVKLSRQMAEQVDVPYMVKSEVASGGSYNYAAACGIPSVLLERGGMGAWETEEVRSMKRDVRSILRFLGIYDGHRSMRKYYPLNVTQVQYQSASYSGLWYPQKKAGDLFTEGEVLGYIKDYEDNILETCISYGDGVILYQTGSLQVIKDGPMVAYGRISYEEDDRKEKIAAYWTKRSDSFLEQRRAELHSPLADRWMEEIRKYLPENESENGRLKILDVGCGTGFFTILLAKQGHQVTGTDLTPDMIANSRILGEEEHVTCDFQVMDAEHLGFSDESFDVVISRNLTWTLPEAAQAYKEWIRVLKPGGLLLNFDANYGATNFAETSGLPENHAHNQLGNSLMQECEDIKRQLPISSYIRPAWDVEELGKLGVEQLAIDLGISKRIYKEKDEFYNPTPMFVIGAKKSQN